ncbi:endosomal/lysosomal proton channel TMEM175 isoform X6 [Manis pentadactyla]|uniref:endosomal/lysosomal proton channel TMEM175 isoform X6 n=1 Tax=Manis pentadactyla TaxID=143292 RepID=UPI00255CC74B|nr:endosomal/lysosomal proton channel TMEM175 isoform X6 [Manis pentadactyla]
MSRPQNSEPGLSTQEGSPAGSRDEEAADGVQHSHRMLNFSDALLSIIATVMILPVTHTEISPEQQFDKSIQKLLATRIAVYLMTFLIVTVAWAAHTRLFQVVGKIDDTLALLNLACMMTITFLPFTFSLMVTFPEVPLGIFLFCMCVIAIGAVQRAPPTGPTTGSMCSASSSRALRSASQQPASPCSSTLRHTCSWRQLSSCPTSARLPAGAEASLWRGQCPRLQGREGEVPRQPSGSAEYVWATLPGLLRLLRHSGPALVCPPLTLPTHPQGHTVHGAAEHALAGLRGWPPAGVPADLSLRPAAPRRARERAHQLRHHLLRQHLPVCHLDHSPVAREGDTAALGTIRRPGARVHVCQACAVPMRQPAGLRLHLLPKQIQHSHLPPHADRRAVWLPAAAPARAPGPGAPAGSVGPCPAHGPQQPWRTVSTPPCFLLA